jgi:phage-related protein
MAKLPYSGEIKPLIWISRSKAELAALPKPVRASFGHRLWQVQNGKTPRDIKALPQVGRGVCELRESFDRNAYRLMYIVNLRSGVYVLHAFMKKSKSGIGIPKPDMETIKARLKKAIATDEMEEER